MKTAEKQGIPLVPIERVAEPKRETSDKATRKMITRLSNSLLPRFPLHIGDEAVEFAGGVRHVLTSSPNNGIKNRLAMRMTPEYELQPHDHVEIISGMCLFGVSGLQANTESGEVISLVNPRKLDSITEPLVDIHMSPILHVSEQETIYRVTKTMQALHDASSTQMADPDMNVQFHLPVPEYHLYMADLHEKGLMNDELYQKVSLMILQRGKALGQLLTRRIPDDVPCQIMSPLEDFLPLLCQLPEYDGVTAEELAQHIAENNEYFAVLNSVQPATSFKEICDMSYTIGYLQTAVAAEQANGKALAVDIAEEAKIFEYAQKTSQQLGLPLNMGALTIAPQTVRATGKNNDMATFLHDMGGGDSIRQLMAVAITNSNL